MKINSTANIIINIFFMIMALVCIFPVALTIGISFSSEGSIINHGYSLFPREFSLEAYNYLFVSPKKILDAYGVTILNTVLGTFLSTLVITLYAYPLSRRDFPLRNFFTFYVFFTMLFSGGTVAWYMVCVNMLGLSNTISSMIVPYLISAWNVLILRTFFATAVSPSIIESGKIDGAGEFRVLFKLVLPISLPGLATIGLFQTLLYWNDWWLPLMFITDPNKYSLQFLLQQMISKIQMINQSAEAAAYLAGEMASVPSESARMALCIVALGPILVIYPFFQKYFIQGLTVGAVKG